MSRPLPSYGELYSISDIHLGGSSPAMQMFCQGKRLRGFIKSLPHRRKSPGTPLALVLAGDVIDSLPFLSTPGHYVAVDGAADILRAVMDDPAFEPVFEGLKDFLEQDGVELIILIGNHDLELALPEAQEALLQRIAPTAGARGRVRFFMQGTGFRCLVGDRNVFITHGNEADPWNHVDHEALRKAAHARTLGLAFDPKTWMPNAGTKLVVDVMNKIKRDHPFIDLLKPEIAAAVKILSVLDRGAVKAFYDALPAFAKAAKAQMGPHVVLGEGGRLVEQHPETIRLLGEAIPAPANYEQPASGSLIRKVEEFEQDKRRPEELVSDSDATLGYWGYWWDKFTGKDEAEALREAVKDWVMGDNSFDLGHRDDTFQGVLSQIGVGIDVIITGHTHLPRWIEALEHGRQVYLNAGTWARLIGLRSSFLEDKKAFEPVYEALKSNDMATLDRTCVEGKWPLILDATAAAHVTDSVAELVRVTGADEDSIDIIPVDPRQSVLEWV